MAQEYRVSEERLLELLRKEEELTALWSGGVDNWPWYHESLINYLDEVTETDLEKGLDQRYDELSYKNLLNEFGQQKV